MTALKSGIGNLRVVSCSSVPFEDRGQAGRNLGAELHKLSGRRAVILGIPRGGVVVARAVADRLQDAEVDVVLSRKLRAPGNPEYAIGAVGEDGGVYLNEELGGIGAPDSGYVAGEKRFQLEEIKRRAVLFRGVRPKVTLAGRVVVLTDDGVATGSTMRAAIWAARKEKPSRLIVALPVGPEETLRALAEDADEVICLKVPSSFAAVGQFYQRFEQTEDEEVVSILRDEARPCP